MNSEQCEPRIPYREFHDIVKLELSGKADPAHEELVRRPEYAVRWLRLLTRILQSIERQNAAANARIHAHPGRTSLGGSAAVAYRKAKAGYESERSARETVMGHIADRIAEAKDSIIEQDAISAQSLDRLATRLLRCDALLTVGDVVSARAELRKVLDSLHSIATIETGDTPTAEAN